MNQDRIATRICRLLDQAADELPPDVQARLSAARQRALARLDTAAARRPRRWSALSAGLRRSNPSLPPTPLWIKLTAAALPAIVLLLGVLLGNRYGHEQSVTAQADAYTEMLTADPPLTAYTDRGFATHLQRVGLNAAQHPEH